MIDIEMNTIEEKILDNIVDICIYNLRGQGISSVKSILKRVDISVKDIQETSRLSKDQIKNALQRLKQKGYVYNRRYKCWNPTDRTIEIVCRDSIKKTLQQGLFPTENQK